LFACLGDPKPYLCNKCNKKFSGPIALEEHDGKDHNGPTYKCHLCGFVMYNRFTYAEHMNGHPDSHVSSQNAELDKNFTNP